MRTNIVLNDTLVQEAMSYSNARSKRALVEEALETFVRVKSEEKRQAEFWRRLDRLQEAFKDVPLAVSSHDMVRADRDR
jgi:Arc/MetJ family transcription regulator